MAADNESTPWRSVPAAQREAKADIHDDDRIRQMEYLPCLANGAFPASPEASQRILEQLRSLFILYPP
jgi:hypothetical protein